MTDASEPQARVWYAAYGSNLLAERFACYLDGGLFRGAGRPHPGARDSAPPTASAAIEVPHRMVFGRDSARWGGGVSFLDPDRGSGAAHVRLWSVTLDQFCDVACQENGLEVGSVRIDPAEVRAAGRLAFAETWYGTAVDLGDHLGDPVLTFTAEAAPPATVPGAPYLEVILAGLVECGAVVDEHTAAGYLLTCAGVAEGWTLDGLIGLNP